LRACGNFGGGEVKKPKLKLKVESKYLGIKNILEFAWPQEGSAAVLAVLRARSMRFLRCFGGQIGRCSMAVVVNPASGELPELLGRDDSMKGSWESSPKARESRKLSKEPNQEFRSQGDWLK
jgi:hypothetical protein